MEKAFILELPKPMCADDGGAFLPRQSSFYRVHVSATDAKLLRTLEAAHGRRVTVHGEAFAAHTAHHRAPVVLIADKITVR